MQFDIPQQDAAGLINLLNKLPTETGVFPLVQSLAAQYNQQVESQPAPTEPT